MCDLEKGFILCKCEVPKPVITKKKVKKRDFVPVKKEYIWTLHKYLGESDGNEMGRYMMPVGILSNGLTHEFVESELNSHNCFDFDYAPAEGDNLIISDSVEFSRLEFIYRNGKWISEHYYPFGVITKRFGEGLLKKTENDILS
ncbi:hypothetical protein [Flavobacterium sp.]|uniref:hypothetical protein n=1 Tax=Flavobacterium sp. TaxID=239 RepID=UPI004034B580